MKTLIGILSCEKFSGRRRFVRESWVLDLQRHPDFDYCFAAGYDNYRLGVDVERTDGDVIYLACDDSYKFLVFKSLALIEYAYNNGYDYLFKCDDDTYICMDRLAQCGFEKFDYVGKEINKKDGKGYASGGAGYFLSRKTMASLLSYLKTNPFPGTRENGSRWCEDSKIGNTIIHNLGIELHNIDGLDTGLGGSIAPHTNNSIITSHYVKDEAMIRVRESFDKEPELSSKVYSMDGNKYASVSAIKTSNNRISYNGVMWDHRDIRFNGRIVKNSIAAHAPHKITIKTEYPIRLNGFMSDTTKGRTKGWLIDFVVDGHTIGSCATCGDETGHIDVLPGTHTLEVNGPNCGGGHCCWKVEFTNEYVHVDGNSNVALFGITMHRLHGPGKMTRNLVSGLEKIGVDVIINRPKDEQQYGRWNNCLCGFCGVNFDLLREDVVLGPCIWNVPSDNGGKREWKIVNKFDRYLCASNWHRDLFRTYPRNEGRMLDKKIGVWGVGVETDVFGDFSGHNKTVDCLVYHKKRSDNDLAKVIDGLEKMGQSYVIISHKSKYTEEDFIDAMKRCRYCVVLDKSETQGIALMEILSANLPMFIFDWPTWNLNSSVPATSLEYFDDRCGIKTNLENDGFSKFDEFLDKLDSYCPRQFVLDDWTLERSAERYMDVMKELYK